MTEHLKVHSRETLYKCDVCKKNSQTFLLDEHMGDHTGDRPYSV